MARTKPEQQGTLPGIPKRCLPKDQRKKENEPRSFAGLVAYFLRCFPDQGKFNYAQTRWALQKVMEKHGITVDDMFIRINRMNGRHPTMTPWEIATCELPDRGRRPDRLAPPDVTDTKTDASDVPQETRDKILTALRRQEAEWEEEQL